MDGLRKPVGDQPPTVYWRRRLIVLVAAIALVLLLWFLISATLAGGDEEPEPSPTTSTTAQAQAVDPDDPSRECTADDLALSVEASPPEVAVGSIPAFDLGIEHTGETACSLSTATEGTDMSVRSGEQIYYSTTWCANSPSIPDADWVLQPGDNEALQATWSGTRVDEQCEPLQEESEAGFYWASLAIGGVPAPEVQFQLITS